jgi:phosphatidylinositol alpha-1,6-mannosyltransferase
LNDPHKALDGTLLALLGDGPGIGGGIARYNCDWLRAQQPRPVHAVLRHSQQPQAWLNGGQFRIASGRLAYIRAAWAMCRQLRPTVIYCGHLHYAPLAAWLCRRFGARLWLQLHGVEAWPIPSASRRRAAESAALVSCVSRYTRSRFLSWARIAAERVRVLPNTVGEEFVPAANQIPNTELQQRIGNLDRPRLLTVGRISASERYKGHDLVIQALPSLLRTSAQVQYLIAGDGDDLPRLRLLAADLGVTDHVVFLGHVAHSDLPDLYRLADLYVMPSSGEGFGIVYLEAMCCGTPALGLAGDGSADPLVDGELGILTASPAHLAGDLASALQRNWDHTRLAQQARARFGFQHFQILIKQLTDRISYA